MGVEDFVASVASVICQHLASYEQSVLAKLTEITETLSRQEARRNARKKTNLARRLQRPRQASLSPQQQPAYVLYMRTFSYTEVGRQMAISRAAATKLVKTAQEKLKTQSRSVSARRTLPTDRRGNSVVAEDE